MRKLITIGLNTIQGFAIPAFNFLIAIFGIKVFGKTDWASLINVMIWVFFLTFVFGWGNRDYLLRSYSEKPGKLYHSFFSNFLSRCFLLPFSLLLFFFFPTQIAIWAVALVVLIFAYTSLATLVVHHQKFFAQLIAETIGFTIIFGSIFYVKEFNLETFLQVYVVSMIVKLIVLSLQLDFWKEPFSAKISIQEFKIGFPFFLLGFSGWLASKTDIYIIDFYLEKSQLAEYQLLITSFLMLQALAAYITIPFTKHVYRVSEKVIQKLKYKLYAIAFPVIALGGFAIWFVMEYFVKLGFSYEYYILGGLIAMPCFFYTLNIMELVKIHKERTILYISFLSFVISVSLIFLLIEEYEIFGVLLSVCITQWIVLITYKLHRSFFLK